MIEISRTVLVNDDPDAPQLDQDQVWHGLLLKANDALPFVPQMESCHVLDARRRLARARHPAARACRCGSG